MNCLVCGKIVRRRDKNWSCWRDFVKKEGCGSWIRYDVAGKNGEVAMGNIYNNKGISWIPKGTLIIMKSEEI